MEAQQPPPLADGVITLRPLVHSDVQRIYERNADPITLDQMLYTIPYTMPMAEEYVSDAMSPTSPAILWGITSDADGGLLVGSVDWRPVPGSGGREGGLGYAMHPDSRGKGHLSRAVSLVLALLDANGVHHIRWDARVYNWGSLRLAWRFGFPPPLPVPYVHVQRGKMIDGWVSTRQRGAKTTMEWDEYRAASTPGEGFVGESVNRPR